VEATSVRLNGVDLGDHELQDARIPLPPGCLAAAHVTVELTHRQPLRPADVSNSADQREIKFGLESIALESVPAGKRRDREHS